jgi:DNA-binding transcriptional LysR family regulator
MVAVRVTPPFHAIIVAAPAYLARRGRPVGVADLAVHACYVFQPLVRDHLAAGRLVQVLPEAAIEQPGLFLYFPRRAAMAPKLRAFIDCAKDELRPRAS